MPSRFNMSVRSNMIAVLTAAASLGLIATPLSAAETPAAKPSADATTLDMASWRDMQCLSMLYMSLTDPKNAEDDKLKGALQLNIGYHLGMLNARSPEVNPSELILSAINKTFAPDGIPADVKAYCQAAAQKVTREGVSVEATINAAIEKAEAEQGGAGEATPEPAPEAPVR